MSTSPALIPSLYHDDHGRCDGCQRNRPVRWFAGAKPNSGKWLCGDCDGSKAGAAADTIKLVNERE